MHSSYHIFFLKKWNMLYMWDLLSLESSKNWLPCFCKSYQLESTIGLSGLAIKSQNTHLSLNFRWYIFFKLSFEVGTQSSGFHYIVYMPMYHYTLFFSQLHYYRCVFVCVCVCMCVSVGSLVRQHALWSQGTALGTHFSFQHGLGGQALLQASTHWAIAPAPLYFSSYSSSHRWPLP